MTNIQLTAGGVRLSLVSPKRKQYTSNFSVTFTVLTPWTDSNGGTITNNLGDIIYFNSVTTANAKPIVLTAPPSDTALDSGER